MARLLEFFFKSNPMPKKITPQKQLDEINQVILADNKIHPAEDKLLKIFTEMFCSNEVVNNLKEQSHNPEARDIMYRFIHLDNILSVALIDGEFHELEVKKCMQIAVTMGFLELEMELLMQKIKLAMETNDDGKNARSIVKSEICNLINQTHFNS